MADVHDLINVNVEVVSTPDLPEIWKMPLFIGSKKAGFPVAGFGSFGDGTIKRTQVVSSLSALAEAGVSTTSELYKAANMWFMNGGQAATLGFVNTTTVEEQDVEETFLEALNAIKQQNNKWYGILPVYANNETKANINTIYKDVAQFCEVNSKMGSFVMRDENDFSALVVDDLATQLSALNYDHCYISGDNKNVDNKLALGSTTLAQSLSHQRGSYDLSWKGENWKGVELGVYTELTRNAMDAKKISYYFLDENDGRTYLFGKTPSGKSACVVMDIDYAKIVMQNRFYKFFKTQDKVPNNRNTQNTIESLIKLSISDLQTAGIFEKCTKQEIADRFFGGIASNVKGYDANLGVSLVMSDITKSENTPNGIYTGTMLYVKINGVIYGLRLNIVGSLN